MKKKLMTVVLFLVPTLCAAQTDHSISLKNANFSLALPVMAATGNGDLYVVFRSFDWLKRSNELVVLAYDIKSHREIRRRTLSVPTVHGPRVANGLYVSKDGQLAYAELQDPCLILLISTQDLSEIRRSTSPLFTAQDRQEVFGGFDNNGLLSFASDNPAGLRFVRIDTKDFHVVSNTTAPAVHQERSQRIVWSAAIKRTWAFRPSGLGSDEWLEYTEEGRATGQKLVGHEGVPNGADAVGESGLVAFFGNMSDAGSVASYNDHRTTELKLQCLPRPYGIGDDPEYVGAICTTSPDREPENGGNKILSSEFFLLKAKGPSIVWRHSITYIDLTEKRGDDAWTHQDGAPMISRSGKRLWVVAPSKSPELDVYEIALPE